MQLVFVHGHGCRATQWDDVRALLPDDVSQSALDLAGHGDRHAETGDFSIEGAATDQLSRIEGDELVLIGHSMGARIVVEMASQAPGRVSQLLLVDGSCVPIRYAPDHDISIQMDTVLDLPTTGFLSEDRIMGEILKDAVMADDQAYFDYAVNMSCWDAQKFKSTMETVSCPTHVLQSTNFPKSEPFDRQFIKDLAHSTWLDAWETHPKASVQTVENCGHYINLECPEAIIDALHKMGVI